MLENLVQKRAIGPDRRNVCQLSVILFYYYNNRVVYSIMPGLNRNFIRYHKLSFAILLFLLMFSSIHYMKPTLLYTTDGGFREFGVGYKNKTVIPIWIVAIVLALFSYLAVMFYISSI